jgi:hypothetical protein
MAREWRRRVLPAVLVAASMAAATGCEGPVPPPGVPQDAVQVTFSPHGGWAHCWLDMAAGVNRCRTYNWRGERLYRFGLENDDDDVFLRYEGTGPVPQEQLQIDIVQTQSDYVWLKNGVVLLPRNAFDLYKGHIDKQMPYMREAERP